jgi:hypothetical protein
MAQHEDRLFGETDDQLLFKSDCERRIKTRQARRDALHATLTLRRENARADDRSGSPQPRRFIMARRPAGAGGDEIEPVVRGGLEPAVARVPAVLPICLQPAEVTNGVADQLRTLKQLRDDAGVASGARRPRNAAKFLIFVFSFIYSGPRRGSLPLSPRRAPAPG